MQASLNRQGGLTFISLAFLLMILGFFVMLALKIGPLYLNNSRVASSVEAVKNTPNITSLPKSEIKAALQKRFGINYVDSVKDEDITIIAQPGYVKLDVEYERVEPIFKNLSVLVEFHEGFETGSR